MANSVNIVRQAAHALGKTDDEQYYAESLTAIKNAYAKLCIAEDGKLVGDFLSNYVCALYFGLVPEKKKAAVAKRMAELVREGDHTVRTGLCRNALSLLCSHRSWLCRGCLQGSAK